MVLKAMNGHAGIKFIELEFQPQDVQRTVSGAQTIDNRLTELATRANRKRESIGSMVRSSTLAIKGRVGAGKAKDQTLDDAATEKGAGSSRVALSRLVKDPRFTEKATSKKESEESVKTRRTGPTARLQTVEENDEIEEKVEV
jgi:hypothetical protein